MMSLAPRRTAKTVKPVAAKSRQVVQREDAAHRKADEALAQPVLSDAIDDGQRGIPEDLHDFRLALRNHLAALSEIGSGGVGMGDVLIDSPGRHQAGGYSNAVAHSRYDARAATSVTKSFLYDADPRLQERQMAREKLTELKLSPRSVCGNDEDVAVDESPPAPPSVLHPPLPELGTVPFDVAAYRRYESKVRAMENESRGDPSITGSDQLRLHVESSAGEQCWVTANPESSIAELRKTIGVGLALKPELLILQNGRHFLEDDHNIGMTGVHGKSLHVTIAHVPRLATGAGGDSARVFSILNGQEEARFRHFCHVNSVAWSPDGSRLATGSDDGHLRIFEVTEDVEELCLDVHVAIRSVAWSPAGTRIVAGGDDFFARVFDVVTGNVEVAVRHPLSVLSVAWHPSGTRIATGCGDHHARIVETATGTVQLCLEHGFAVNSVAFCREGQNLLTGSSDGCARVFELSNSAQETCYDLGSGVGCVAWSPKGRIFAAGCRNGMTRLFNASTDEEVGCLSHAGQVNTVAWNSAGTKIATGSSDGAACVYDVDALAQEARIDHDRFVYSVAFAP